MTLLTLMAVALSVAGVVLGDGFVCPAGYTDKSGEPKCWGAAPSTCSAISCCDKTLTCSDMSVSWVGAQALGGGCLKNNAGKFFDLKKMSTTIAAPAGESQIAAACCTPLSAATCADWNLMRCSVGKKPTATQTASAPANSGLSLTQSSFDSKCCEDAGDVCTKHEAAWLIAQVVGGGCREGGAKSFFDLKKRLNTVQSSSTADIKAACCTDAADATCADWILPCSTGTKVVEPTKKRSADAADGISLKSGTFQSSCCDYPPKTCANFLLAACDGNKFFDLKKLAVGVAKPGNTADVKAACCTDFADATCQDWNLMSCAQGTFPVAGTTKAPADSSDGKSLSLAKFRSTCCGQPMKCSEWVEATDADSSTKSSLSFAIAGFLIVALSSM